MKTQVVRTFSPFGPVLPGSPGGPYTIKIRSEESMHEPKAGRWEEAKAGRGSLGPSSSAASFSLQIQGSRHGRKDTPHSPAQDPPP